MPKCTFCNNEISETDELFFDLQHKAKEIGLDAMQAIINPERTRLWNNIKKPRIGEKCGFCRQTRRW